LSVSVLLEKKAAVFALKVQSTPQLGGDGSGALPKFYVATGKSDHAAVGIDLGTRNIRCVCVQENQLIDATGLIASSVQVLSNGKLSVGHTESASSEDLIHSVRTKLGTDWVANQVNFHFTAQQVYSTLMYWVKLKCNAQLGKPVSKAVITVPVSFTSNQRRLVKEIAEAEGLEVLRLINEPTAAALCYFSENPQNNGRHLVVTMGGGAFGITAIEFSNGIIEVKSCSGEEIEGDDFDQLLVRHSIDECSNANNLTVRLNAATIERFRAAAEKAKKDLSFSETAHIRITNLTLEDAGILNLIGLGNYNLITSITRDSYAEIVSSLTHKFQQHLAHVLAEARWEAGAVDRIIFDGGMLDQPLIHKIVTATVSAAQVKTPPLSYAAASGAALQAHLILEDRRDMIVWDTISIPVLAERSDGSCATVIARNTPLPVRAYCQVQAQNATACAAIFQGNSNKAADNAHQGDALVNSCPPASNDSQNIEIAVIVDQDGIIEYGARHIGLNVNLTTSVYPAINTAYKSNIADLENFRNLPQDTLFYQHRIERLARRLNIEADRIFEALHSMGYTTGSIKNRTAIESLLHKLKKTKHKKRA